MSNCIIVPTDFSANANNALNYAIGFASVTKSKLILAHAFHIAYLASDAPIPYIEEQLHAVEKTAETKLRKLCVTIKAKHKLECDFINLNRLAPDLIVESARSIEPILIIMGTKGAGKIKGMFMGTNTSRVIARTSCPVLVIPEKAVFKSIKNATYAANYQPGDAANIREIAKLLHPFKSHITVLHVGMKGYSAEVENEEMNLLADKVRKDVNDKNIGFELIYGKYLEKALEAYVKRESPNMLVMSSRKRSLFGRLFQTGYTKAMTYHLKIPLLALHYKIKKKQYE